MGSEASKPQEKQREENVSSSSKGTTTTSAKLGGETSTSAKPKAELRENVSSRAPSKIGGEASANKPKEKPVLNKDAIYAEAEKLMFPRSDDEWTWFNQADFTEKNNPYTNFTRQSQVHLDAMLAQFAKMGRIEFRRSEDGEKEWISFYRNSYHFGSTTDKLAPEFDRNVFAGPYHVSKGMALDIVNHGKLRVSTVRTKDYLDDNIVSTEDIAFLAEKTPIEVFASLFLRNNGEEIPKDYKLNIEVLKVIEFEHIIEANLLLLLALNSVEILLHSSGDFFDPTLSLPMAFGYLSDVRATRTKHIIVHSIFLVDFQIEDIGSFGLKWQRKVHFLVNCCPNLEQLEIYSGFNFPENDFTPEQILQYLNGAVNAIRKILEQLDEGSEKLHVSVKFTSCCADRGDLETLTSVDNNSTEEQKLFKLGTPFDPHVDHNFDDEEQSSLSRSLTIVDKTGRRSHLLKFTVFQKLPLPQELLSTD